MEAKTEMDVQVNTRGAGSFRALFEVCLDPVIVLDAQGSILELNDAASQLGVAPAQAPIGQHVRIFFPLDDLDVHDEVLGRALGGEPQHYEARLRGLDGRTIRAAISAVPISRDDVTSGLLFIARDVDRERFMAKRLRESERELAKSERRLRVLFANVPDAVLATDCDGIIRDCNDAATRIIGRSAGEMLNHGIEGFLALGERDESAATLRRAAAGETLSVVAAASPTSDLRRELHVIIVPHYELGNVAGLYFIAQDVTESRSAGRRAEIAARNLRDLHVIVASADYSDARMMAMLELGCNAFEAGAGAVVDCTGEPVITALHECAGKDAIPSSLLLDIAQVAMDDARSAVARHPNGWGVRVMVNGEPFGAIVFASKNPSWSSQAERAADLLGLMSTLMGSSVERRRVREHLRQIAYYDALTGLPNRAYAQERLHDAIEAARQSRLRVAVLLLDLDNFRDVNETQGYQRADRLICAVATRLERELSTRGTVARLSGDKFLVVIPNCRDANHAHDLAERMLAVIGEPFLIGEQDHYLSTSVGVAIYPDDGADDQALIKNADIAMYRAKDRGRGTCLFYDATLEAPIHMRISQERLLRRALDRHEFEVYYQPQVDLRTGAVICVEALVRWNHPESGLIEPAHFIPSAEMSGLIVPLGDWVLETAARQVAQWQTTIGPLRLAVNLSARQFHQRDLLRMIFSSLKDAPLDPRLLEVEITESIAMSDAEGTATLLADLKRGGVRTALDDFGTGYSSLSYLRRFDFDVLKIDRSFISGIGTQSSDETIVKAVIAMAHSLDLEVVAEGVENATQLAFLRQQGCEIIQGHVVAPAIPAQRLEQLLLALQADTAQKVP